MPSAYTAGGRRFVSGDRYALLGSALGTSTVTGRLSITRRFDLMEGRALGEPRFNARLRVDQILGGETARGVATVRGALAPRRFGGVMVGRSTVTGTLLIKKNLRAWPVGQASGEGIIHIEKPLVGTARGAALHQSLLRVEQILGGEPVIGTSRTDGGLLIEKAFAGAAEGSTRAFGAPFISKPLAGALSASGTASGALEVGKVLTGAAKGSTGFEAVLRNGSTLRAAATGSSSAIGGLVIAKSFKGSASGAAIVAALMEPPVTYRRTQSEDIRTTESGDVRQAERDVI